MKKLFIFLSLAFLSQLILAQNSTILLNNNGFHQNSNSYFSFFIGAHSNPFLKASGTLHLELPYLINTYSTSYNESASFYQTQTSFNPWLVNGGFEFGNNKGYGRFSVAGNANNLSFAVGGGKTVKMPIENLFFKAGINLSFNNQYVTLGSVDNRNKEVVIDGNNFGPTFTYTTNVNNRTYYHTAYSDFIRVNYRAFNVNLSPTIALEYVTPNKGTTFRISASYNTLGAMSESVKLVQKGAGRTGKTKSIPFRSAGITENFTGYTPKPFTINQIQYGFEVGFRLGK